MPIIRLEYAENNNKVFQVNMLNNLLVVVEILYFVLYSRNQVLIVKQITFCNLQLVDIYS